MSRAVFYEPPILTMSQRDYQTELIMNLFKLWGLTDKEKAIALGLSPNTPSSIQAYKSGEKNLPIYRDIQDRITLLLAIHKNLRAAYPANKQLAYKWITTRNLDFSNMTPFEIIAREGFWGLHEIKKYLEISLRC